MVLKKGNKLSKKEFKKLNPKLQSEVFLDMNSSSKKKILKSLNKKEITKFIHFLDPYEITNFLKKINERKRKKILETLENDIRSKVEYMLRFSKDAAASIMNLDYLIANKNYSINKLKNEVEDHIETTGKTPTILFIEESGKISEVPIFILFKSKTNKLTPYLKPVECVRFDENPKEIIKIFKKNPHKKIVVLDEDNSIMGIIYAHDLLPLIDKKTTTDIYGFAGVHKEEDILDQPLRKVKSRYKWLILNLFTAFLAASVVGLFQDSISKLVILAVYLPIVAGMGGNAATQTLAVVVRGLALREITAANKWKILTYEVISGILNGLITGIIVAIVAYFTAGSYMLGVVIGISMITNLMIAGFFATIVPLILKNLGADPASASSIFITTATDIFGFLIFLGLATLLLL